MIAGNVGANENPMRAMAVIATEIAVTIPVGIRLASLEYIMELTTVPPQTVMLMNPAYEIGTLRSAYIIGQAAPSIESGSPSEMNAMYMIAARSSENMEDIMHLKYIIINISSVKKL